MRRARSFTAAVVLSLWVPAQGLAADSDDAARRQWVEQLSSSDPQTRLAAAHGLGLMGRDASGEAAALLPLLKDPEAAVRLEAVRALLAVHAVGGPVAAAAWKSQGSDADPEVRKQARRLAKRLDLDSPAAATELRRGLASEHADARRAAVSSLPDVADHAAGDVNSLLVLVLDDEDEGVRSEAIEALAELGSPLRLHQGVLRERLQAADEVMALRAAELLEDATPLEDATLSELVELLLRAKGSRLRRAVLDRLTERAKPSPELAERLLAELAQAGGVRLEAAVLGLGALGTGSAAEVEALIDLRLDRSGPRGAALKALVELTRERGALPHVAASLASPFQERRIVAAEVLEDTGEAARSQSASLVTIASEEPDAELRSAALAALAAVAEESVARPVLEAALKDRSSEVRSTAAVQLEILRRREEHRSRKER